MKQSAGKCVGARTAADALCTAFCGRRTHGKTQRTTASLLAAFVATGPAQNREAAHVRTSHQQGKNLTSLRANWEILRKEILRTGIRTAPKAAAISMFDGQDLYDLA